MAGLNIKNCVRCKKIFMPVGKEKMCPDCRAGEIELEERVKAYVRDHRGITVNQLIEGTGVPAKLIWRMIQQGLFENSGLLDAQYPCGRCGKLISKDVYCSECAGKLKENAQKFAAAMSSRQRAAEKQSTGKTFSESMYEDIKSSRSR